MSTKDDTNILLSRVGVENLNYRGFDPVPMPNENRGAWKIFGSIDAPPTEQPAPASYAPVSHQPPAMVPTHHAPAVTAPAEPPLLTPAPIAEAPAIVAPPPAPEPEPEPEPETVAAFVPEAQPEAAAAEPMPPEPVVEDVKVPEVQVSDSPAPEDTSYEVTAELPISSTHATVVSLDDVAPVRPGPKPNKLGAMFKRPAPEPEPEPVPEPAGTNLGQLFKRLG